MYIYIGIYRYYMYIHIFKHTSTYIPTYIHTSMHTYIHTYVHTYMHAYIHTYIHTYTCVYTYIYIYSYTHTHTRTHTHTHTRTCSWLDMVLGHLGMWLHYLFRPLQYILLRGPAQLCIPSLLRPSVLPRLSFHGRTPKRVAPGDLANPYVYQSSIL